MSQSQVDMQEEQKDELKQEVENSLPSVEAPNNRRKRLVISLVSVAVLFLISVAVVAGVQIGKKQNNNTTSFPIPTTVIPTAETSPTLIPEGPKPTSDTQPTQIPSQKYSTPQRWQKYSDSEAGITISYPPQYTAKNNSNRGFGVNYSAGSYLLDPKGQRILDFYRFSYSGGSRRESFYDAVEFDGPEDMSKFTVSTSDVNLNNRTFLKLVSNYWTKYGQEGNRIFFLIPQGSFIFYFTYSQSIEANKDDYLNILTVIANSVISDRSSGGGQGDLTTYCYPRPDSSNRGTYWDSSIEGEGNMVITQRTDKALKQQAVDKAKIEISGNPQKISSTYFSITDFDINIDSSKKGGYQDAFVIKIKKQDVDRIKLETPTSIPSVAVIVSISGGVETSTGGICKSHLYGYYVPARP